MPWVVLTSPSGPGEDAISILLLPQEERREGSCPGKATGNWEYSAGTPGILMPLLALPGHFHLVRLQGNDGNLARSDP